MARKASVVIEKDEHGFYAWCPELKGVSREGTRLKRPSPTYERQSSSILKTFRPARSAS